jgi:hypothetical protein
MGDAVGGGAPAQELVQDVDRDVGPRHLISAAALSEYHHDRAGSTSL